MTKNQDWPVKWDVMLRYRLIECVALWERRLTTNHLMSAFGIGRQQASRDLNTYIREYAPNNLKYDTSLKGYRPTAHFQPVVTRGIATEYLELVGMHQGIANVLTAPGVSSLQYIHMLDVPHRDLRPLVLAPVLEASRESMRLEICYSSLGSPEPEYRVIQPHTVVFNGHRWHVRAWCEKRSRYSDFVLSRISDDPDMVLPGENGREGDSLWNTEIELRIGPDPRLSKAQQKMIERDYAMESGHFIVKTCAALVNYCLQNLRIEFESSETQPEVQQITLLNRSEIDQWLFLPVANKRNSCEK